LDEYEWNNPPFDLSDWYPDRLSHNRLKIPLESYHTSEVADHKDILPSDSHNRNKGNLVGMVEGNPKWN
jgi:hypothetical protein